MLAPIRQGDQTSVMSKNPVFFKSDRAGKVVTQALPTWNQVRDWLADLEGFRAACEKASGDSPKRLG